MMNNYGKEPKLKVIIEDDTCGMVEMPTKDYVVSTLKSTTTTLESSIESLEHATDVKMEIQAKNFNCKLEERDRKIQHLSNELNEMSKLNTHLIKHGAKRAHCELIPYRNMLLSTYTNYKIKFNFVNDSYKYDEYEFKLDDLTGGDTKLHLCKLKNIGKDRIKVKIKVYDSVNRLVKKLKYIVDIKGKNYIQL